MLSDQNLTGGSVIRIAGKLFAQFRAIGQFSSQSGGQEGQLNDDLIKRIGFLRSLFQALESTVGLRFESEETTFVYNTYSWTAERIAGFADGSAQLYPSQIIDSYFGGWRVQWDAKAEETRSTRFLRAALWICNTEGLERAITYLSESYMSGLILESDTLAWSILQLLMASHTAPDDRAVVGEFFPQGIPQNTADWIGFPIQPVSADSDLVKQSEKWLPFFVELTFSVFERIAQSSSYDNWLTGRWRTEGLLEALFVKLHWGNQLSLPMRTALDQIEEVRADTGGMQDVFRAYPHNRYFLTKLSAFKLLYLEVQRRDPEGWKDRLVEERFLVPKAVAEQVFAEQFFDVPIEWQGLSFGYASALAFWLTGNSDVTTVRQRPFDTEQVRSSPATETAFEEAGIQGAQHRNAIERSIVHPEWTPRWETFIAAARNLPGDKDQIEPAENAEKTALSDWWKENENQIQELRASITQELSLNELQSSIKQAGEFPKSSLAERAAMWKETISLYPYFHFGCLEIAVALDESNRAREALPWIEQAILALPHDQMRWHSLAVISKHLDRPEDAIAAAAISEMIGGQ